MGLKSFVGVILVACSLLISGCNHVCHCGCLDCGISCVNHCEGNRCLIGEKCCDDCTYRK